MARGVQLEELILRVRAATKQSLAPNHGINTRDALIERLNRLQETLIEEYEWEHLRVSREVSFPANTRFQTLPDDMTYEGIQQVWAPYGSAWREISQGITPVEYSTYPVGRVGSYVERWRVDGADPRQMEIWPVRDTPVTLILYGALAPKRMVQDADVSMLDGNLLVLLAAAEILAQRGAEDATVMQGKANTLLERLLKRQRSHKSGPFVLGGGLRAGRLRNPRPGLDYIP